MDEAEAKKFLWFFEGAPLRSCVTCTKRPEARPGVRLCRECLEIAATCLTVIKSQEVEADTLYGCTCPFPRTICPSCGRDCATCAAAARIT